VRQDPNSPVPLWVPGPELLPPEVDGARRRPKAAAKDPEEGGLSGSVGPEDRHELSRGKGESDAVHRPQGAELPDESLGPEDRSVLRRRGRLSVGSCGAG
jgi:hypothetical protein